jgi:chemotaxis protein MotB
MPKLVSDKRPIIIKRKKGGGHGGHHGGAWKVAFADFMTAMMAFFLVMWVCGLSESKRRAIAGYFREPGIFSFTTGKALPTEITEGARHQGDGSGSGDTSTHGRLFELSREQKCGTPPRSADDKKRLARLAEEIRGRLEKLARKDRELNLILGSVTLEITNEGLRIEIAESNDLAFFDVGGAKPNRVMKEVLATLAPRLQQLGNKLGIEGHTDTRAYPAGASYTNWELSADRANAARKILVDNGVPVEQIDGVTGYGDRRLRKPDRPHDVVNRRVSIIVRYPETK